MLTCISGIWYLPVLILEVQVGKCCLWVIKQKNSLVFFGFYFVCSNQLQPLIEKYKKIKNSLTEPHKWLYSTEINYMSRIVKLIASMASIFNLFLCASLEH